MHEQRESFPLEDIHGPGEAMPPRCRQFRFPGMHSDVGGGYLPEEQGKNGSGDENKLARIPLNEMYRAAVAAGVPLKAQTRVAQDEGGDPFEISDELQSEYDAFIAANGTGVRAITDCLIDILAWRYQYRHCYATLPFVQAAGEADKHDLVGAHEVFLKDIGEHHQQAAAIDNSQPSAANKKLSWGRIFGLNRAEASDGQASETKPSMPTSRREVFDQIVQRKLSDVELSFFSAYCHDSYAGFKPFDQPVISSLVSRNAPWEDGGYLRYRTRYAGESLRLAMQEINQRDQESVATTQDQRSATAA
jgi:hypothetical protein